MGKAERTGEKLEENRQQGGQPSTPSGGSSSGERAAGKDAASALNESAANTSTQGDSTEAASENSRPGQAKFDRHAHVISFMSGKGGTGKTVIAVSLGTLLMKVGFRVLFVDLDFATDGMTLYIAGASELNEQVSNGFQLDFDTTGSIMNQASSQMIESRTTRFIPYTRRQHMRQSAAFGDTFTAEWQALFTSLAAFGDESAMTFQRGGGADQSEYELALDTLFKEIHGSKSYDYVIVDTRGGFDVGTALVGKFVDSLIVVTEPDRSSLNQSYKLVNEILNFRQDSKERAGAIFQGLIVNKSTDRVREDENWVVDAEGDFRNIFETLIGIPYKNHYVMPLDDAVVLSYRENFNPILSRPESMFSLALMHGFTSIFGVEIESWESKTLAAWEKIAEVLVQENDRRLKEEALQFKHQMHNDPEYMSKLAEIASLETAVKRLTADSEFDKRMSEREEKRYQEHIDQEKQRAIRLETELDREKVRHDDMVKFVEAKFSDRVGILDSKISELSHTILKRASDIEVIVGQNRQEVLDISRSLEESYSFSKLTGQRNHEDLLLAKDYIVDLRERLYLDVEEGVTFRRLMVIYSRILLSLMFIVFGVSAVFFGDEILSFARSIFLLEQR